MHPRTEENLAIEPPPQSAAAETENKASEKQILEEDINATQGKEIK